MALFPRRIDGRFWAMCRTDGESNGVASSADGVVWGEPEIVQRPLEAWELVQIGNCGSPIETDQGWLVLTHGVGPMRTYAIGAILLDLEDPTRVVGRLREPLLETTPDERHGYVPHVLYSCGGLVHDDLLATGGTAQALCSLVEQLGGVVVGCRRQGAALRLEVNRALTQVYLSGDIETIYGQWLGKIGRPTGLLAAMYLLNAIPE